MQNFKSYFLVALSLILLGGCSTNPATGENQFTGLMSPAQEQNIGSQEHQKVVETFGVLPANDSLSVYVSNIGKTVAANTERTDVNYKFYVVDSAMVNAFAIPGGYIYVTRGLLAQANSEAEVAAVIAHEIGHITGRHSAERYSQGVLTSLGAMVLSAAIDSPAATQALGVGSELFLRSYSRGQENEADELGVRYLSRAGYDPYAMASFLANLEQYSNFEADGQTQASFFSTHPQTGDRVELAMAHAAKFPSGTRDNNHDGHLQRIDGMVYGDSEKQGFAKGNSFYHPGMGFTFTVPNGFDITNQPTEVVAQDPRSGSVILFDAAGSNQNVDPATYISQVWMKGEKLSGLERTTINGKDAATASFAGRLNNKPVTVRLVAVEWAPNKFFRFQMAYPQNASAALLEELKRTTYSLRPMTSSEKSSIRPYRIDIARASSGQSVASMASRMDYPDRQEARFRVLNNLGNKGLVSGRTYKIVVD